MKVNLNGMTSPNFGRALTTNQKQGFRDLTQRAKELLGADGLSVLKIDSSALPSDDPNNDTGVGKLNSAQRAKFVDMMKTYTGCNAIKDFPSGQVTKLKNGSYYGAYNRSALTLGDDKINLNKLTTPSYQSLLSQDEVNGFSQHQYYPKNLINYEHELGRSDMDETPVAKGSYPDYFYVHTGADDKRNIMNEYKKDLARTKGLMYKAWERFQELDDSNPLKEEYNEFYSASSPVDYDDMYTRLALAPFLKSGAVPYLSDGDDNIRGKDIWSDGYHFFEKFDVDPDSLNDWDRHQQRLKKEKYEVMKEEYKDEIDYFKFRQFIAHKQLKEAKNEINSQGAALFSDCLTGFSHWEQLVYPDAFFPGAGGRMGLPVLNYNQIQDPNSPASKLLEQKVKYNLDNYDGIRFDVGWAYINAVYQIDGCDRFKWLGDSITQRIAHWAREVKGQNYDTRNLIYEFDNAGELKLFKMQKWGKPEETPTEAIDELKNLEGMAVLTTEFEHNDTNKNGKGWMNTHFLKHGVHLNQDKYILGTNNHDGTPLAILATADSSKYHELRDKNRGALMKVFNNYNADNFSHPSDFVKSKFAELFTTKNQFLFFMDVFGRKERVDSHCDKDGWGENNGGTEDYRKRLTPDFEEEYHRAIQRGEGFNFAEILARAMEAKDNNSNGEFLRNGENKRIYNELRAYANYLYDCRDEITTEEKANRFFNNSYSIPDEYRTDYTNDRFYK